MRRLAERFARFYLAASIAAALLAALTAFAYLRGLRSQAAENGRLVGVLVAARDLEAGEVLSGDSLQTVPFPDRYLFPGTFTDVSQVSGAVLRHPLRSGEPVLASALVQPGVGAPVPPVEPGFRAYPLPASTFSFPPSCLHQGCRVDVISASEGSARLLLENVEVLGVFPEEATATYGGAASPSLQGEERACLLLKVTPEEACLLTDAREHERVEVVLRPAREP